MAFTLIILILKAWLFLSPLAATVLVLAQTFPQYPLSNTWPNLSPACVTALNTTVQCSDLLPISAENNVPRLNDQNLTSLCTASCLSSLNSAKATIQAGCTLDTDVIPLGAAKYPATYLVDLFLYTYSINCRRDAATQQYCDVLLTQWLNGPSGKLTAAQNCSDCMLGVSQLQLNSPFGYDRDFASSFTSLTLSCNKPGYPFTSPPPYTAPTATGTTSATGTASVPSSPSSTADLDPGCVTLYTIQAGDTCNSIARAQNVSTWAVYGSSGLTDCSNLPTGSQLCLVGQCDLYQVQATDTCDGIIQAANITVSPSVFVAWNPNINAMCTNLDRSVGNYICLSRPDGLPNPVMAAPDANAPATATAWPTVVVPEETQLPLAPGTLTGCPEYLNYQDTTVQDSFYQPVAQVYLHTVNKCYYVASVNNAKIDDFLSWNPSLNPDPSNCTLAAGYSYCINNGNHSGLPQPPSKPCLTSYNASTIVPGTSPSCNCYTEYYGSDSETITCRDVVVDFNITVAELQALNPWIGTSCDTGLFANLTEHDPRAICVGTGNGTATTTTSTTSTRSTTTTGAPTSTRSSTTTTSTTTFTTSSSSSSTRTTSSLGPATSTPGTVCILGAHTDNPNQAGLCSFACHFGYCPPGPCMCTAYGTQVPEPPITGTPGYPLAGLDPSYLGLCSYACNHGYCPNTACTTNPNGSL